MSQPREPSDPWSSPAEGSPPPPTPESGTTPPPPYGQPPQSSSPAPYAPGGYGQPPAYGPPSQYGYGYAQPRSTNGFAIASMVLGIVWIYWLGSVLALIFGYIARGQIRAGNQQGDGMAIAGIVLGWIGVGTLLLLIFLGAAAGAGVFA